MKGGEPGNQGDRETGRQGCRDVGRWGGGEAGMWGYGDVGRKLRRYESACPNGRERLWL